MKRKSLFKLKLFIFSLACIFTLLNCTKNENAEVDKETPPPIVPQEPQAVVVRKGPVFENGFEHPGILNTQAQIDFFVEKANTNQQPWLAAFEKLRDSPYASLAYKHTAFSSVDCGSYNNPNVGCDEMVKDGMAAYCQTLMYLVTKDVKYAISATKIITDWSAKYQKNTKSNARLVVSWATPWYTNSAELLRYNYSGWTDANTNSFKAMLDKFLPYVTDDTMPGNNWVLSSIEAHIAIAIFKSDKAMFAAATDRWKTRVKTYIFQSSDGPKPIKVPGKTDAETATMWKNKATSTSYVDGMALETCRDLGHLGLGFNSMMYAAQSAWNQKTDLFTLEKKRLTDFMELHGSWMTGSVAVPASICGGVVKLKEADANGIMVGKGGGQTAWEIAYSHLNKRLNMPLPYTLQMLEKQRPNGTFIWVTKGETLTHANWVF